LISRGEVSLLLFYFNMNGFAIIESKDSFLIKLANGNISPEMLVFIEDSREI
jgi:hypothetical protein